MMTTYRRARAFYCPSPSARKSDAPLIVRTSDGLRGGSSPGFRQRSGASRRGPRRPRRQLACDPVVARREPILGSCGCCWHQLRHATGNAADVEVLVPLPSEPLQKLGFLTIGLFDEADPRRGHESTLEIIELGEQLGFDSAWVRHRHLQFGISSPVAVLAAASQRTRPHRPRHGRHPPGLGEPAAAGRRSGHGRHLVRRPPQPRCQRRAADALRPGQARALPRYR